MCETCSKLTIKAPERRRLCACICLLGGDNCSKNSGAGIFLFSYPKFDSNTDITQTNPKLKLIQTNP